VEKEVASNGDLLLGGCPNARLAAGDTHFECPKTMIMTTTSSVSMSGLEIFLGTSGEFDWL
jgi:hypothetical protein